MVTAKKSNAVRVTRYNLRQAADLLKQVSDPTRLQVLLMLGDREQNVGQMCEALGILRQPALSHHLALLRLGRLIEPRRSGKNNIYSLTEQGQSLCRMISGVTAGL